MDIGILDYFEIYQTYVSKLITTQIMLGGLHGWGLVEMWTYSLL
jgi:hypothetical protein